MRSTSDGLHLSASDLANHLSCRHVTTLDRAAAEGRIEPPKWRRPGLDALRERGAQHERAYITHLLKQGLSAVHGGDSDGTGVAWTLQAMRSGADVIVQAPLASGRFAGRADLLRRVPGQSALGDWAYEVLDTKLARETRAGTILQLALYSELLAELQGRLPEQMHVVSPGRGFVPESFRVEDFRAYFRWVRRRLERAVESGDEPYPAPVAHCEVCRWWPRCDRRRRADDHLSLVAGLSSLQSRELESRAIASLASLANLPLPLPWSPRRGARDGYVRVREQARVQLEARVSRRKVHELLEPLPGLGLARLPEPSPGDLFLDLEGDPYVGTCGLEYLFGLASLGEGGAPVYACAWATTPAEEKAAFEHLIDTIQVHWERYPDLHVFHYGAYDPAALKRLMGRHATREREIDRILRAGRFVDLHAVVRQALRAGVERYSIKDLEPFYGFERTMPLDQVTPWRRALEHALEMGHPDAADDEVRPCIEGYNRDDCVSAMRLRDWLERLRAGAIESGRIIPRPPPPEDGAPAATVDERELRTRALAERLTRGLPDDPGARSEEQRARALLADLLEWHRREEKAPWWEYFRLLECSEEDLMDEKAAVAGLAFVETIETRKRSRVERYSFPPQETSVREDDELQARDLGKFGEVVAMDPVAGIVDIKVSGACIGRHPASVFAHKVVGSRVMADAILRIGDRVSTQGWVGDDSFRAARDLLLRLPPRLAAGVELECPGEPPVRAAERIATALECGVLVIQGPPGAGKTFTAARMIVGLVAAGRTVGVSAQSHAVIRNLLDRVVVEAATSNHEISILQKVKRAGDGEGPVRESADNAEVRRALAEGAVNVVGGTAWLWAREDFHEAVDVLFVDEAGQMSLANALAVSQGAKSLVLVGDPQQLEQPIHGSHPEGAEASALEHMLAGHRTLSAGKGLFLDETWRLHPSICEFTSETFYEGRLRSRTGLDRQALAGPAFAGSGLWFVPVDHHGNQSASSEEVAEVRRLFDVLLAGETRWIDDQGEERTLGLADVLVIAPYNAQVADLARALPRGARVGTVDRFQGQEAPVVIVSMATSIPEDAPRGMEFLYSLHRFNVATSRARAACILVASPRLFEPDCRSPRQMRLANAWCRYLERSRRWSLENALTS